MITKTRVFKLYAQLKKELSDYDIVCGYNNGDLKVPDWVGIGQNINGVSSSGNTWLMWDNDEKNPIENMLCLNAIEPEEEE